MINLYVRMESFMDSIGVTYPDITSINKNVLTKTYVLQFCDGIFCYFLPKDSQNVISIFNCIANFTTLLQLNFLNSKEDLSNLMWIKGKYYLSLYNHKYNIEILKFIWINFKKYKNKIEILTD